MSSARQNTASATSGTSTLALGFGGYTPTSNATEEFTGETLTATANTIDFD